VSELVAATPARLADLAVHIRESDRVELWLSHQNTPEQAVRHCLKLSLWSYCLVDDLGTIAAFGLGGLPMSTVCAPWALAREKGVSRADWGRFSRPIVQRMRQDVELLENWVHAGNIQSIRWLKSCGFTLDAPKPYGALGAPFHRFWMRGTLCATR
jgi:hypothetical protein